jgi:hypothetical protein
MNEGERIEKGMTPGMDRTPRVTEGDRQTNQRQPLAGDTPREKPARPTNMPRNDSDKKPSGN